VGVQTRAPSVAVPALDTGLSIQSLQVAQIDTRNADPNTAEPYVMWPDTPYEHLMLPVR
jgi:hypothetical protein